MGDAESVGWVLLLVLLTEPDQGPKAIEWPQSAQTTSSHLRHPPMAIGEIADRSTIAPIG
jgi:hypothetical protein